MTPEEFAALGEHLESTDPVWEAFCFWHQFERSFDRGLYPYRKVVRDRQGVQQAISLEMCVDPHGKYYCRFFEGIPYSLWAFASVDIPTGQHAWIRHGTSANLFAEVPFVEVMGGLESGLNSALEHLKRWDQEWLLEFGETGRVGPALNT